MDETPLPRSLITRPAQMPQRQNKTFIGGVVGCVVLLAVVFVVWKMRGKQPIVRGELRDQPVTESTLLRTPSTPREDLRMTTTYRGLALPTTAPATPGPALLPETPLVTPAVLRDAPPAPQDRLPLQRPIMPDRPQAVTPPPRPAPAPSSPPPAGRPVSTTPPPPPKEAPKRWFTTAGHMQGLAAPFPDTAEEQAKRQESQLFPKATWERPKDPTKILYADQLIPVQLVQDMNSDIPGTVRVKSTSAVRDRWGHGHTILPQDTAFLLAQEGSVVQGQRRFIVSVPMAILPDGTAIRWQNGQAGDAGGAVGIPAKVDNKIPQLLLATGLSAVLSIGTRAPFGNTQGYHPSLPQEFAEDVSRDVNRSGQSIIDRQLNIKPTLTQFFGYPLVLMFKDNVSFQTPPTIVTQ